jgi:AraC-type DNA-binding domain-containing proteins
MFDLKYREYFSGLGIGRIARDSDFCVPLGFLRNEYQIHYLYSGKRLYFVNGECYTMEAGSIALIDKKRIPKTCIIGGQYHDRLLIELKGDVFIELGRLLGFDFEKLFDQYYGVYDLKEIPEANEVLAELEQLIVNKGSLQEVLVKSKVLGLLCMVPTWKEKKVVKNQEKAIESSVSKQKRVHQVADYISKNYEKIHSVEALAETFYMSKSYLCRIFKEVINFTISEYINLHRIEASTQYLKAGKHSITEIANMVGYSSLTYFEKVFKREMHLSPLQYRKQEQRR